MFTGTMNRSFEIIEGFSADISGTCVGWDDYRISNGKLFTVGIGPCLAIAIYDAKQRTGALAHISGARRETVPKPVHPEHIIRTLVSRLQNYGNLEVFLVGEGYGDHGMSERARRDLYLFDIPVIGEDLGSLKNHRGREVHLDCQAGIVQVYRYPY